MLSLHLSKDFDCEMFKGERNNTCFNRAKGGRGVITSNEKRNLVTMSCLIWFLARLLNSIQMHDHTLMNSTGKLKFNYLLMKCSCCWLCLMAKDRIC